MIAELASPPAIHLVIPAPPPAPALDHDRVLRVVLMLENHKWSQPGGALAFQRKSWFEDTTLSFYYAGIKWRAWGVAQKRLARFAGVAEHAGVKWNATIAFDSWRWGIDEAISRAKSKHPSDYAVRGTNLYEDPTFK